MGHHSEKQIEEADLRAQALDILAKTETLQKCEHHETYYQGSGDLTAAYKLANHLLGGSGTVTLEERRQLTDAIKAAYEENCFADRCERCADVKD